jgi:hypothetical protein
MYLIYKEKIYLDRETKAPIEVETPLGKFKTNVPALVLFFFGFVFLTTPVYKLWNFNKNIKVTGSLKSTKHPIDIFAVVETESIPRDGRFAIGVPALFDQSKEYKIIYSLGNIIVDHDPVKLKNAKGDEVDLGKKNLQFEMEDVPIYEATENIAPMTQP